MVERRKTVDRRAKQLGYLRNRKLAKDWSLPVLGGGLGLIAYYWTGFVSLDALKAIFEPIAEIVSSLDLPSVDLPWTESFSEVIASALVPIFILRGFVSLAPVSGAIDRMFPDPPTFVFSDLDAERAQTMSLLERDPIEFVGRKEALSELSELLDRSSFQERPFVWQYLNGVSGTGKTRLGIEWLALAEDAGWDVGLLDRLAISSIRNWKPRRPTALVMDEARSQWRSELEEVLADLQNASGSKHPIRVLIISLIPPYGIGAEPQAIREQLVSSPIVLTPMSPDEQDAFEQKLVGEDKKKRQSIRQRCGGNLRAAIILANAKDGRTIEEALDDWCYRLLPQLRDAASDLPDAHSIPLIFSALIGPLSKQQLTALGPDIDARQLSRYYDDEIDNGLAGLPRIEPVELGLSLSLKLLDRLPPQRRDSVISKVILDDPDAVEESLAELSRKVDMWPRGIQTIETLQAAYDASHPGRVSALREQGAAIVAAIAKAEKNDQLEQLEGVFDQIVARRPLDQEIRLAEAVATVNAINRYGKAGARGEEGAFASLERWAERLDKFAAHPVFGKDKDIRLHEAKATMNAITSYGEAGARGEEGAFVSLERWGERLDKFAAHPVFGKDKDIRLHEAMATVNAITSYGDAGAKGEEGAFVSLERWAERLDKFAAHPVFGKDKDIRLHEAKATVNAINRYGEAGAKGEEGAFASLERWGERLDKFAAHPVFGKDKDIRLHEAMATVNAIGSYGEAGAKGEEGAFASLERWGERLDKFAAHPVFGKDKDIRLEEAKATVNAINRYGEAGAKGEEGAFASLERWGERLDKFAAHPVFGKDKDIRLHEAMATMNAINRYGEAGAKGEEGAFASLERWGERLDKFAAHPVFGKDKDIRLHEAKATMNAINRYGEAGVQGQGRAFASLERWGERLDKFAAHPVFGKDREIRLEEAMVTVNAIANYGKAGAKGEEGAFASLERWGERLDKFAAHPVFGKDKDIRLEEAKATVNAINRYGEAGAKGEEGAFASLERWGERLDKFAAHPVFGKDKDIRLHEAMATVNAIILYRRATQLGPVRRWRRRLALLAQQFRYDPQITENSHRENLTFSDQKAQNWPFGRWNPPKHDR